MWIKKNKTVIIILLSIFIIGGSYLIYYFRDTIFEPKWEIVDELDGNIFPSIVLSLAKSDSSIISPVDSNFIGNVKSGFAIKIENQKANSNVRILLDESEFYNSTTSEFKLPEKDKIYYVYPNVVWKYEKLQNNQQPTPLDVSLQVSLDGKDLGHDSRTFSVRGINECLLGYKDKNSKYHDTGIFFAAYVNEDHPMIDKILREALDTKIVRRFQGYQAKDKENVKKQVYAIWYALQKRNFKYSSISKTSLSSDMIFSQRVRTLDNSLESSQINCIDGSVLFASFLRAINIDPIIVRIPGHVFIGFYLDKKHTEKMFLETTLIGDIDLEEYATQDQLDEALVYEQIQAEIADTIPNDSVVNNSIIKNNQKLSQGQISKKTFDFAIEDANQRYLKHEKYFGTTKPNYMFLEINNNTRKIIQPIGK